MKKVFILFSSIVLLTTYSATAQQNSDNKELAGLFERYFEEQLRLSPLTATSIGDLRYNDLLPATFTDSYRCSTEKVLIPHRLHL